jgi:KipI family sensor histidine kinase inhibitor
LISARVRDVADGAIVVEYPEAGEEEANRAAVELSAFLAGRFPAGEGLLDRIPGARTLFCEFDPLRISHETITRAIESAAPASEAAEGPAPRLHRIPVRYGEEAGEAGADLRALASAAAMDPARFVSLHASAEYRVAFLGFAPGFAYMTGLPEALRFPRLATPRTRVPAGSLAIAGPYAGIYPNAGPGGWNLIGSAAARLFDPRRDPPALLLPGDRVVFEPAGSAQFEEDEERSIPSVPAPEGDPILRVESPGLWSGVCGAPRPGSGAVGAPPGGAMDLASLSAGNRALGNPSGSAALEIVLSGPGPVLEATAGVVAVLSGAPCEATLDGVGLPLRQGVPFSMTAGQSLSIRPGRAGARAYLCVAGGFAEPRPFLPPVRIGAGDLLARLRSDPEVKSVRLARSPDLSADPVVRIVLGSQVERFSPRGVSLILESSYRVSSASDRRGVRLDGPPLEAEASLGGAEIPSEGTALGAIQVPAGGQPIVLGPDRPITGGYAKIGTVISADFPILAQARPGSTVRFRSVGLTEAVEARGRMSGP